MKRRDLMRILMQGGTLAVLSRASARAQQLEIVDLRHRRAEEILPVIEPMLQASDTATGRDYTLFLRVAPGRLEEIRHIIARLDAPQRQLLISVRQGGARVADHSDVSVTGALGGRDVHIANDPDLRPNTVILQGAARHSDTQQDVSQQVRVLDGEVAFVATGGTRFVPQSMTHRVDGVAVVTRSATEQSIATGFYVLPRMSGDRVTLEIATQREAFAPRGRTTGQGVTTTVTGMIGEWIEIGGIDRSASRSDRGLLQSGSASATENSRISVRVEMLDGR